MYNKVVMEKIINFVKEKHKDQKYGEKSYFYHLEGVAKVAEEFLSSYPRIIQLKKACYLHDILEDTDISKKELFNIVSSDIIDIIERVTDKDGKNRKERHLKTYYLTREKEEAVLVKLCDRIFNIREGNKIKLYKKEKDYFKFSLFDPRHSYAKSLWKEYDRLLSSNL